ncbi:MAG: geranylgeranylglyceryl/heptaprenylglyceryl phosphate synthase [Candidatus Micrarchaeaceae archaeon]
MKKGKVEKYIEDTLEEKGAMFFALIDPVDYETAEKAIKTAKECAEGGADLVLIGGSIGAQGKLLDDVAKGIKESVNVPVVLFPGNIATVSPYADAIYFMSLLNARNPYWITQVQMLAAPLIRHLGIEPLPVGYIVIHPGGTVGWVGDVNLVPREKPKIAAALALAGEYIGNRFILTDAGSNPQLQNSGPVPSAIIKEVKSSISVPYIVGGGLTTIEDVKIALKSGADIVQIGAVFQTAKDPKKLAKEFCEVVKEEGKVKH